MRKSPLSILFITILFSVMLFGCHDETDTVFEEVEEGFVEEKQTPAEKPDATGKREEVVIEQSPACPDSCDDNNPCTLDKCSEDTDFICVNEPIAPCCGNDECEKGETASTCADDCKACPADARKCYRSVYDYEKKTCVTKKVNNCCGNNACDFGESCNTCPLDCGECDKGLSLKEYPTFLEKKVYIIVGVSGKGDDVFASSAIANTLTTQKFSVDTKFTTDLSKIGEKDSIFVGGPCTDQIIQDFFGLDDCNDFLEDNQAIIKISKINSHYVIFVSGKTSKDTRTASKMLADFRNYNLYGEEILVDTSKDTPKRISSI